MTSLEDAAVFSRTEPLEKAVERLATVPANRGLVVDDGMLRGLLSITDASRLIEAARRSSPPRRATGGDGGGPKLGRDEDHDRRLPGEHAGLPG
jgi:hypothetical protein